MTEAVRLFLECSTPRASLALLRGGEVVYQESFSSDRSHHAMLFAPLVRALERLEPAEKLAGVVIGTGPGSYSGTRVGIAAGQGVALVHGCPAAGLSSLLAVPAAAAGRALAVGDARRGSGWRMRIGGGREPELCGMEELALEIAASLEEGVPVFSVEPISDMGLPEELAMCVGREQPDSIHLASAWLGLPMEERELLEKIPPQPAYLRPPHVTIAKVGHPLLRK